MIYDYILMIDIIRLFCQTIVIILGLDDQVILASTIDTYPWRVIDRQTKVLDVS